MELFSRLIFYLLLFLSFCHKPSLCQQEYLNSTCLISGNISEGYFCGGGDMKSCKSYVTFRSQTPYDNASSIANHLGSEASEIASLNNILPNVKIPANKLIIVPTSCACPSGFFQHFSTYILENNDTYYTVANITYQGLTTCQALESQNSNYDVVDLTSGITELIVRVRCACPSYNQTESGVNSLLTYVVDKGERIASIGKMFGVSEQNLLEANMLSNESEILPFTPILVPLRIEACSVNPRMFFCGCPGNQSLGGLNCISNQGKRFPVKLVTLLGTRSLLSLSKASN